VRTPSATPSPDPANGLVLALGFNENAGTTLTDASGKGNTGTTTNTTWTTGKYGSALTYNGTNSWSTIPSSASLNLASSLTLEAWVYPTANTGWRPS